MINIFIIKVLLKLECVWDFQVILPKTNEQTTGLQCPFCDFEIAKRLSKNVQSYRNSRKTSCSDR